MPLFAKTPMTLPAQDFRMSWLLQTIPSVKRLPVIRQFRLHGSFFFLRLLTAPVQNIVVRLRLGRSSHSLFCSDCVSPSSATGGGEASSPRGTAAAVEAKNTPPACFLNASTVLQEITSSLLIRRLQQCSRFALLFSDEL